MYGLGRCENKDCIQVNCERLNEVGAVYDFRHVCNVTNNFEWFEGKDKLDVSLIEKEEEFCE